MMRPGFAPKLLALSWVLFPLLCSSNERCAEAIRSSPILQYSLSTGGARYHFIGTVHIQTDRTDQVIASVVAACTNEKFFFEHWGKPPLSHRPGPRRWAPGSPEASVRAKRIEAMLAETNLVIEIASKKPGSTIREGSIDALLFDSLRKKDTDISALEYQEDLIERFLDVATSIMEDKLQTLRQRRQEEALRFNAVVNAWHLSDEATLKEDFLNQCNEDAYSKYFCESIVWERNQTFAKSLCSDRAMDRTNVVIVGLAHLVGPRSVQSAVMDSCSTRPESE
jgi:uncharacterized protein YbaP (TraB family)